MGEKDIDRCSRPYGEYNMIMYWNLKNAIHLIQTDKMDSNRCLFPLIEEGKSEGDRGFQGENSLDDVFRQCRLKVFDNSIQSKLCITGGLTQKMMGFAENPLKNRHKK